MGVVLPFLLSESFPVESLSGIFNPVSCYNTVCFCVLFEQQKSVSHITLARLVFLSEKGGQSEKSSTFLATLLPLFWGCQPDILAHLTAGGFQIYLHQLTVLCMVTLLYFCVFSQYILLYHHASYDSVFSWLFPSSWEVVQLLCPILDKCFLLS